MRQLTYFIVAFLFTACASSGKNVEKVSSAAGVNLVRIPASETDTDNTISHVDGDAAKVIYESLPGTWRQLSVGGPYVYYKFKNADKKREIFESTSNGLPAHKGGIVCYMTNKNLEWGQPKLTPDDPPQPITYDCYTRIN